MSVVQPISYLLWLCYEWRYSIIYLSVFIHILANFPEW